MIQITSHQQGSNTVVRIAGRLEEDHLAELQQHCAVNEEKLAIDVSEVRGADSESIRWMHAVAERGAAITGPSPYIALLLKRAEQQLGDGASNFNLRRIAPVRKHQQFRPRRCRHGR